MPFFDIVSLIFETLFLAIKAAWWVAVPLFLVSKIKRYYLLYKIIKYFRKLQFVLLEITLPPDVLKTPKAMENVFAGMHGSWTDLTFRDRWVKGEVQDRFSLEIIGENGELHFYIRCLARQRNFIESTIYAQYPDAALREVEDYAQHLPPDLPNKDYDLWGADFILNNTQWYPIRTYFEFEDIAEERRLDPISQLAEMVAHMQTGEHLWIQIIISPVLTEVRGKWKETVDDMLGRKAPAPIGLFLEIFDFFSALYQVMIEGKEAPPRREAEIVKPREVIHLTPGERETLEAVERKNSKVGYMTTIRGIYIARRDVMNKANIAGMHGFFRQFAHLGANSFRPDSKTFPKSSFIVFPEMRKYIRKRRLIMAYRFRFLGFLSKPYFLNIEEVASLFHLPGRVVTAPFVPRVPARRAEPPRGLPT